MAVWTRSTKCSGLHDRFGDAVATYRTKDELHELIERFLRDPDERRRRAARGQEIVLGAHTFAHVTDALLCEIESVSPAEALPLRGRPGQPPLVKR